MDQAAHASVVTRKRTSGMGPSFEMKTDVELFPT
jgi:hypothetical protein